VAVDPNVAAAATHARRVLDDIGHPVDQRAGRGSQGDPRSLNEGGGRHGSCGRRSSAVKPDAVIRSIRMARRLSAHGTRRYSETNSGATARRRGPETA
jgi:hypothetical protein